ncbi:cation channel sperm-associated auxiliary subunit TMEM249 isoform X3 [Symphalangus syndactylus]
MLLFVISVVLLSFSSLREVQKQETWVFLVYGVGVGLWLVISSLPRRRLVLNHPRGVYHFSIQGRTVCQGPLHLIYVRLALSSDAYGRCFFQLVLGGHRLEPLVLVQLSEHYEVGPSSGHDDTDHCLRSLGGAVSARRSKWNTWGVTSPGNSTSTTSTTWPPPTGTWFATGHPLALALCCAGTPWVTSPAPLSPTWRCDSEGLPHPGTAFSVTSQSHSGRSNVSLTHWPSFQ